MTRIREKLTYANVMSTLAVFLLLGGGAYAAKKKLIDTDDIANQAVTGKKIAKSTIKSKNLKDGKAVTGADVKDGAIGDADLGSGIGGAKLADGSVAEAKLAAEEQLHVVGDSGEPDFNNGGEGDCTWADGRDQLPELTPVGFRKDRFGNVILSGVPFPEENAGAGDEECGSTAPEPDDTIEDLVVFTLPAGYRPEAALLRLASPDVIALIAGDAPVVLTGTGTVPAGSVMLIPFSGGGGVLDGISYPAADQNVIPRSAPEKLSAAQLDLLGL